jgi:hypothetical protein
VIRARLIAGEDVGMTALNHLRLCCGMMGGSPADRSKVGIVEEPEHDPLAHYFTSTDRSELRFGFRKDHYRT